MLDTLRSLLLLVTILVLAGADDEPTEISRTDRDMRGWTIRVDDRLLEGEHEALGIDALDVLDAKLADIVIVVPEPALTKLREVTIVLDLDHELRTFQYHPSAQWLRLNGHDPELAKCVHLCRAGDLPTKRTIREQPWVILHELAHAYHDQVLGFEEARITKAYEDYTSSGDGDDVLLFNGRRVEHYALTDQKEFFAEMTEAYFGSNDFFPFNRAELMTAQREVYELMRDIWEAE